MKIKSDKIRFFSPTDNSDQAEKIAPREPALTVAVTKTGRLAFSQKLLDDLNLDPASPHVKVGTVNRRKGAYVLYLKPTSESDPEAFVLVKTGRGYSLPLKGIWQRMGLDFTAQTHQFAIRPYDFGDGVLGFELVSQETTPRVAANP